MLSACLCNPGVVLKSTWKSKPGCFFNLCSLLWSARCIFQPPASSVVHQSASQFSTRPSLLPGSALQTSTSTFWNKAPFQPLSVQIVGPVLTEQAWLHPLKQLWAFNSYVKLMHMLQKSFSWSHLKCIFCKQKCTQTFWGEGAKEDKHTFSLHFGSQKNYVSINQRGRSVCSQTRRAFSICFGSY